MSFAKTPNFLGHPEAIDIEPEIAGPTIKEDICHVFDSPQGQRLLMWLRHECHFVRSTFVKGDSDQTALNEGKRLVYLAILAHYQQDDAQLIEQARAAAMKGRG